MKKKSRKPTDMRRKKYPLVQIDCDGKIWIQATPAGKWAKVPPVWAKYIGGRLQRASKYALKKRVERQE